MSIFCIENYKKQKEVLLLSRSWIEDSLVFEGEWYGWHNEYNPYERLLCV